MKQIIKKLIPYFLLDWYHFLLAFLGAVLYGFPSKKLKVIGVTGTNGKSTVIEMISSILEQAGFKIAALSSIKFKIADKEEINMLKMTMPGRFTLQKLLKRAVNSKCQYAVIEVTSEGIKQHRHRFIDFSLAVFTNLSPEHIEAHGSFEKYRQAKEELFKITKDVHVLNTDDKNVNHFLKYKADKKYGYGLTANKNIDHQLIATNYEANPNSTIFKVNNIDFKLNLIGKFNVYNALAAICVGLSEDISLETCKKALEKIKYIPGRMEIVVASPFKVIVDYAFTPNALEKVYSSIKNNFNSPKMICVLSAAGGGRDKWKRPVLGKIAAKYCQHIIITNEDPYDENPKDIIDQVAQGAENKAEKIMDREKAINSALKKAKTNDVVIITGKGCEPWICIEKGKKIPWDDKKIVKQEFEKLNYGIKK
ncbi:MAG: UDP-N-acetylmuramoyl-L-alanyl-D-glutamate--2,6-diaminopimelate ligase [Candidatus Nealsonbacteria bacterium]